MTDKQIIIDGLNLKYIKELLYNGQRSAITTNIFEAIIEELEHKEQECEELKKQLMQKSEIDMFFNTPLEGWSSDPCGICKYKNCLTEIKDIAKQEIDSKEFMIVQCMLNGNVDDKNKVLKQILQKISECEVLNGFRY